MATFTTQTKSTEPVWDAQDKAQTSPAGTPVGMLLAITRAESQETIQWTFQNKN